MREFVWTISYLLASIFLSLSLTSLILLAWETQAGSAIRQGAALAEAALFHPQDSEVCCGVWTCRAPASDATLHFQREGQCFNPVGEIKCYCKEWDIMLT